MPIYDYECRSCGKGVEDVFQKVTEPPMVDCPHCGDNGLYRVVTGGLYGHMAGSETVGSLADKNAKLNKNKIAEAEHKKQEAKPQAEKPWYHKYGGATSKEINKMTDKQKLRYIMEGRK